MTFKAIRLCRVGVLLLALLCFLISVGFLLAHPKIGLSVFVDLGGLLADDQSAWLPGARTVWSHLGLVASGAAPGFERKIGI